MFNGQQYFFKHGIGYIEGNGGISFPKRYIWTQCLFKNGSLMLSVADISFLGIRFTGIIGIVLLNGKEHRIATYLGANVKYIGENIVRACSVSFYARLLLQILPLTASKILEIRHYSCSLVPCHRQNYV